VRCPERRRLSDPDPPQFFPSERPFPAAALSFCGTPRGLQSPASDRPRYAAFFVTCLPVPLHAEHSATMDAAYTAAGT